MIKNLCVVVADAARARIYALGTRETPEGKVAPRLAEVADLVHPERRLTDSEMFTNTRPGSHQSPAVGGPGHAFDDRRDSHKDELDRRFAREVVEVAAQQAREQEAVEVVLCAPPQMLGHLRSHSRLWGQNGLTVTEVPKDLTRFTPSQLHDNLAADAILPGRDVRE